MKNLFLPFVVVALFAIGSCGDEASINPPVDKQDTTKIDPVQIFRIVKIDSGIVSGSFESHIIENGSNYNGIAGDRFYISDQTFSDRKDDTSGAKWFGWWNSENYYLSLATDFKTKSLKNFSVGSGVSYMLFERGMHFKADSIPYSIVGKQMIVSIDSPTLINESSFRRLNNHKNEPFVSISSIKLVGCYIKLYFSIE